MTKLLAGPNGLDMTSDLDFSGYPDATPTTANAGKVIFNVDGFDVTVKGAGFTYGGPNEFPADGLINSVRVSYLGVPVVSITKTAIDVSDMRAALAGGHPELIAAALFGGDDKIYGGDDGSNTLVGLAGDDVIVGGNQADELHGDSGEDVLSGGRGRDQLFGGANSDTYLFRSTLDSRKASPDIIYQITNDDRIDLRAIDANINKDGNQAFEIVDAFTHKAGQMTLTYDFATYYTTILMDVDGDAKADMSILLDGTVGGFEDHSDFTNFVF